MSELARRTAAVEATRAHFAGKPFAWGKVDCAKIGAFHLRQMGRHDALGLSRAGTYRSALSARRALARAGHESLSAALDSIGLVRIPPAAALPGDIVLTPGTDDWEALGIIAGNDAVLSFHEDADGLDYARVFDWSAAEAWRV
ncbi:DUF6950 family protein [Sphingomonas faeni]|uniref:DUF6950 family protein n=1 Tax=Sphingomonas faeni TaxID=185950 RepID=UPI0033464611